MVSWAEGKKYPLWAGKCFPKLSMLTSYFLVQETPVNQKYHKYQLYCNLVAMKSIGIYLTLTIAVFTLKALLTGYILT